MILLLKLAYRNIFRNFRRSLLTFLTLSFGVALSILFIGFSLGLERQSIRLSVETAKSHLKIHQQGYSDDDLTLTLEKTLDNYDNLLASVRATGNVIRAEERILFPASLSNGIDELRLTGVAMPFDRANATFNIKDQIISGKYFEADEDQVLLTDKIAKLFSLSAGDYITVVARTKYDAINALDLEIAGIIEIGNPEIDNTSFFMPLSITQEFLDMQNMVTEICVRTTSMEDAEAVATVLRDDQSGSGIEVITWQTMIADLIRMYDLRSKSRGVLIFILFLMASSSVMNTMLMAIFERLREIGTIMALGLRRGKIQALFLFEGMFLGIFGSLVGTLIGGSGTYYLKVNGINLSQAKGVDMGNMPIASIVYTEITLQIVIFAFLIGVVIAVLSALYPAYKGSRMQPTDALKYV